MPQRNGPAVDVGFGRIEAEPFHTAQGLGGESFVEFDQADVVDAEAEPLQQFFGGRDRTVAHDPRVDTGGGGTQPAEFGFEVQFRGFFGVHHQQGGGPVVDAAGITGGHRTALAEGRAQFAHVFQGGGQFIGAVALFVAGVFVRIHYQRIAFALGDGDRNDLIGKASGIDGVDGAAMAFDGKGILFLAADLHLIGNVFRRLAETDDRIHLVHLRIVETPADGGVPHSGVAHLWRPLRFRHGPGGPAHAFDAAANENIAFLGKDCLGCLIDGLQGRRTISVDGNAGHFLGETGQQNRHAGDVPVVFTGLVAAPGIDVIEQCRIDAGAFHEGFIDIRQQVVGADTGKRPAEFTNRAAGAINDHDFFHGLLSCLVEGQALNKGAVRVPDSNRL